VAASAASVPPSSAPIDTVMTRTNRVLRDKGARLEVGSRIVFLKDRAGSVGPIFPPVAERTFAQLYSKFGDT
jgi:hypothetical protein